ncbi:transcriptional regulator [Actinomadura rubrobrunea]|uniref:Transcriptional regulator n=1 Tax=Actinomadura rubrobrunea TaxID=115335 RepID=A0A9W6Q2Y5_9ACTN|nr:transcriptional regulator [Actinomadura rubrobrunea]
MTKNGELREFLRSRRARLRPEDVGIQTDGRRRVPGLRREEVAMLAGVSLDYYTRLEQGRRNLQPSDQVLDAIARALRLAEVERLYLHNLVRSTVAVSEPAEPRLAPLGAGTRVMLDALGIPAIIVDVRGDVHAVNRLGRALLPGLEPGASHLRWLFLDPATRDLLTDWEMMARVSVGVLREAAARYPRDRRLHALIGELSVASPEFRNWWADHEVETRCQGPKRFRHPVVGELTLHVEALQLQDRERWVYAYSAEPGSPSAEALRLLGTWAATEDTTPEAAPRPPDGHSVRMGGVVKNGRSSTHS